MSIIKKLAATAIAAAGMYVLRTGGKKALKAAAGRIGGTSRKVTKTAAESTVANKKVHRKRKPYTAKAKRAAA